MIDARKAYTYFFEVHGCKRSSQNWYAFDCPICDGGKGKRKMAVHFGYEYVKCWSCEYRARLLDFVGEFEGKSYIEARSFIYNFKPSDINHDLLEAVQIVDTGKAVELPFSFIPILDGKGVLGRRAIAYLESRNFDVELLDKMGFGYCNKHHEEIDQDYYGRIIVPFKAGGRLYYYLGRTFVNDNLRYKNPSAESLGIGAGEIVFNEDALVFSNEVFVLEGAFDAMTIGDNAIATLKWDISNPQKSKLLKSSAERLVFVPDVGYYRESIINALDFVEHKDVYVLNMDTLSHLGKDVNEMGAEAVFDLYANTPKLTYELAMAEIL